MNRYLYTVTVKNNSLWEIKEILKHIKDNPSEEDYTFEIEVPAVTKYVPPVKQLKKIAPPVKKKRKRNIIKDDSADVI
jgi:hypothetical protein